jgi:hypothetical protein
MTDQELLHSAKIRVKDAKRNSKKKKDDRGKFDLSPEDIVSVYHQQNSRCVVTGIQFTPVIEGKNRKQTNPYTAFSIDRIDCSKGYCKGNIRLVTNVVNIARRDRSTELADEHWSQFIEMMRNSLCH